MFYPYLSRSTDTDTDDRGWPTTRSLEWKWRRRIAYPCGPILRVATMPAWSDGQMNEAGGGLGARLPTRCSSRIEKSPRVNM
jgi:hypothetical protein